MDALSCDSPVLGVELMSVDDVLQRLEAQVTPLVKTEIVSLVDSLQRVLAKSVESNENVPPHANSSMDGYAICWADWCDDKRVDHPVSQRIPAGSVGSKLERNTAARIFTGAPIPEGADVVVMQELCSTNQVEGRQYLTISTLPDVGENIRSVGEDIKAGSVILNSGHQLRSQDLGLLASIGVTSVEVYVRLRVAVFFTGDEIKEPGELLEPGQIYNSNRYTLTAMLKRWDCQVVGLGNVRDTLTATVEMFKYASEIADLIITSGGVSVGEEDHIRPALEQLGELAIWRISLKPGKPLAFGKIDHVPFIGLPGNPVSVFVTSCVLARPFIKALQGMPFASVTGIPIRAGFDLHYEVRRREYLRVRLQVGVDGVQTVVPFPNQSSGVLTSASWADGFAVIREGCRLSAGDDVEFIPFSFYEI